MAASDDGVREIQLSGKQLVFLFMAVTVVSVVIFLCGVLVGRGVQARASVAAAAVGVTDAEADPTAPATVAPAPTGPTRLNGLEYQDRLESSGAAPEKLTTRPSPSTTPAAPVTVLPGAAPATAAAPAPTLAPAARPTPASTPPPPATAPATTAAPAAKDVPVSTAMAEPRGDGFAIQVAALRGRGEAEGVVTRLKSKGFDAFLMPPLNGQPSVYRVRVGKFKTRAEAEAIATRLEREEQFQPWITR